MALPLPSHPLDVETNASHYGIALAYAAHLRNDENALELLGVDGMAWARARTWPDRFVDEVGRGQLALLTAFGVAFKETQARLRDADAPSPSAPVIEAAPALGPGMLAQLSNDALARPAPALEAQRPADAPPVASWRGEEPEAHPPSGQVSAPPRTVPASEVEARRAPGPAMPFDPSKPSTLAERSAVAPKLPSEGEINLDSTAEAAVLPVRAALPFVAPGGAPTVAASPSPHELTVGQYASLCATLEAFPDKAAIILQRYGITEEHELERFHRSWHARFATDAASHAAFQRQLRDIRERLGGSK